ncbi:NAD-dependent epimerase/dehydratase family protein [Paenibacillus sacheonensis]|uniref:NAD-dependent epimerase/dehydratase family protein n=1 Tax=Paenibacillus sacheonensis TaxID=742054 RepID=A0A7X5BZU3_9BACL|nr:NAD(P)-dependent oxidoreductase [Paenibacillus sacheonensis]MBM7569198.1 nucleoside-diphosphate-sugar epimerase [Paenibacillus sacheonensis]NBC73023.1 NAD-dependent epimerase/dehydratase family protein [Paenibacillus sacheonensis]
MKVVITGACGFVGRKLIQELEERGHELVLIDRQRPEEATMFVPGGRVSSPFQTDWPFYQADIMDTAAMQAIIRDVDAVVHLAAIPSGLPETGQETFYFNASGTYALLDAARLAGVNRFIAASSINAFGTFYWRIRQSPIAYTHFPLTEAFHPEPQDPYSLSKLVNELTCESFHRAYGIRTAALRFGGVWSDEVYDRAMEQGLSQTEEWPMDLFTWVHVRDIAIAIRQALEESDLPGFGAYTINASDTNRPESTMELLHKFRPEYLPLLNANIEGRGALISSERANLAFGYKPKYSLDAAVNR